MMNLTLGLDLGSVDYSAAVVIERLRVLPDAVSLTDWNRRPAEYAQQTVDEIHVRQLRRWPLGTPYTAVVADVEDSMSRAPLDAAVLVFDGTGVGRAVRDMFRHQQYVGRTYPIGVTVTGGEKRHGYNLPKTDLVAALAVPLEQRRLKIAAGLQLGDALERELLQFRRTITPAGREQVDILRRENQGHGDLASALMLACAIDLYPYQRRVVERTTT